jgi:hypothetical protein
MKWEIWLVVCLVLAAQACATSRATVPARLDRPTAATIAQVKVALAKAMGKARIELGPIDYATSTSLFVLPPPPSLYETRSLATPTVFDIKRQGQTCLLVRRESGQTIALDGVACVAMPG